MSTIPFEAFLAKFSELKSKINSNPRNLSWRAKNDSSLGELASELMGYSQQIEHALASSPQKFAIPPIENFAAILREYRETWKDIVGSVGAHWVKANFDEWFKTIDLNKLIAEDADLAATLDRPPNFNPAIEDAYELLDDIFWWADTMMGNYEGTDTGDSLHKAFQAWEYFERTIGVDLQNIHRRWRKANIVFIPRHVADAHGLGESGGLFDLLNEAHRAFVFGTHGAAIAMCRALMETVLKKHYHLTASDLDGIIALAETKHSWMRNLPLQGMRRLSNNVLHECQQADEEAVIEFLACVKELIERAPNPKT